MAAWRWAPRGASTGLCLSCTEFEPWTVFVSVKKMCLPGLKCHLITSLFDTILIPGLREMISGT